MSDARQAILAAIARNKKPRTGVEHAHVLPERGLSAGPQRLKMFEEMALASAATIEHIGALSELPAAVARYLSTQPDRDETRTIHINSPLLTPLDWLSPVADRTTCDHPVSVTDAFCGIAETGSVMLMSRPGVSSAAYFLPEILCIALAEDRVLPNQEEAWRRLQTDCPEQPRSVTLVTGPSRTGDIEQKLVIGAHGPRRVHLVLYGR